VNALQVKAAVRKRDGYRCTQCGATNDEHFAEYRRQLEVHRLTPGSAYTVEDSITVCRPCHHKLTRSARRRRGQADLAAPDRGCPVVLDKKLHAKLKLLAAFSHTSAKDYLDGIIRQAITTAYQELVNHINAECAKIEEEPPAPHPS
jgi:hypothetical protein